MANHQIDHCCPLHGILQGGTRTQIEGLANRPVDSLQYPKSPLKPKEVQIQLGWRIVQLHDFLFQRQRPVYQC